MLVTCLFKCFGPQPKESLEEFGVKLLSAPDSVDLKLVAKRVRFDVLCVKVSKAIQPATIFLDSISKLRTPTVVFSRYMTETIQTELLSHGATCVIPFSDSRQLKALKVRSLASASKNKPVEQEFLEGLYLNPSTFESSYRGTPLKLTRKEFRLLLLLTVNHGAFVHRQTITEWLEVPNYDGTRAVDMMVSRLRSKLVDALNSELLIDAEYGLGYKIRQA